MSQTVIVKKPKSPKAPQDRKPKASPATASAASNAIDLGDEDEGPQPIPVRFLRDDEVWYDARLPKGTMALALGDEMKGIDMDDPASMREAVNRFTRLLFSKADYDAITARLDDPDDRLDLVHLRRLVNRIAERGAGLPTM